MLKNPANELTLEIVVNTPTKEELKKAADIAYVAIRMTPADLDRALNNRTSSKVPS
jgi:hypothetical protein